MIDCLIEWLKLSENLKLFETFEWEGIKWLSLFAFEFKFIQFKSWREDDMTSSNKRIWKVDLKISENILFGIYFIFGSILKFKRIQIHLPQISKFERRNMTLQTRGILWNIWTIKPMGLFEKYLQKEIKSI